MRDFNLHTYATTDDHGKVRTFIVPRLWKLAEEFPVEDVPLAPLVEANKEYINKTWGPMDWVKVRNCDLNYPIILGESDDEVMDGVHRVMQAHHLGHTTIKARRIRVLPEPDLIFDNWNDHFMYFKQPSSK